MDFISVVHRKGKSMHCLRTLAFLAALAVTGAAHAQMMNPGGMAGRGAGSGYASSRTLNCDSAFGMRSAMGQGMTGYGAGAADPAPAVQQALDRMQAQLALTAGQLPAWNAYEAAVLDQADDMADFRDEMLTTTRSAVEWSRRHATFMLQRAQGAARIADTMEALYAQLSAEQRIIFESIYAPCTVVPGP